MSAKRDIILFKDETFYNTEITFKSHLLKYLLIP
jgi:hypothetical protein